MFFRMFQKFRAWSLERQIFAGFLSASILLLILSLGVTLYFQIRRQRQEVDSQISSMAAYIASIDRVPAMLEAGYPDAAVTKELNSLYAAFPDINVISICDRDGLRFYHSDRTQSGETFTGGEETAILSGSAPYITTGYGTRGTQRRAFHAIAGRDGSIVGFVMVSVFMTRITSQITRLLGLYGILFLVMLAVSVILSRGIVFVLKDSLLGHHPKELLDLYLRQGSVLNAMTEGIIATDRVGNVIFENQAAGTLFEGEELLGKRLDEVFPESAARTVAKTGEAIYGKSCMLRGRQLILNELPIGAKPDIQGVLTICNDRTEVEALFDELSGTRSMLDTLRAFNHEFLNKLHVILGYLQTGQTEAAISFIMNSNLVTSDAIRRTAFCLRDSKICALVIGKMMHAAELGITLTLAPDSRLREGELFLPSDACVTLIGNLLENAIEELSAADREVKEITLAIHCSDACSIFSCEDTGRGIPPELAAHIFERGVSSKGENRGTGLFLIKELTERYGGEISLETEPGEGTCFTVTFTKPEGQ